MSNRVPEYAIHNDQMISGFFGDYRFLSNFWPAPMTIEGVNYPTVEHAFQAWKAQTIIERRMIAAAPTPGQAKMKGSKIKLRPDWESMKFDVMQFLVGVKFIKHPQLRQMLLDTGKRELIEANDWNDQTWGVAYVKNDETWEEVGGGNYLGKILTNVRRML